VASPSSPQSTTANFLPKLDLRLVVIDHYDSFTYNLVDLLAQYTVHPPIVVAADTPMAQMQKILQQDNNKIDGLVLSPGPGHPRDCDLAAQVVAALPDTPILGVCLGHQILATVYGATVVPAPTPVHGQVHTITFPWNITNSTISHHATTITERTSATTDDNDDPLWQRARALLSDGTATKTNTSTTNDMTNDTTQIDKHDPWHVTRYHSLHVTNLEQSSLIPTAFVQEQNSDKQILMAFRHATFPHYGVQFHPESVGSNHGWALIRAFCDICHEFQQERRNVMEDNSSSSFASSVPTRTPPNPTAPSLIGESNSKAAVNEEETTTGRAFSDNIHHSTTSVYIYAVPSCDMTPLEVMEQFLMDCDYKFWLDTADEQRRRRPCSLTEHRHHHTVSILGAATERVEYWGKEAPLQQQGVYVYRHNDTSTTCEINLTSPATTVLHHYPDMDILTYLDQNYAQSTDSVTMVGQSPHGCFATVDTVEDSWETFGFSYRGGHVGYLGYEVRHDTTEYLTHQEGGQWRPPLLNNKDGQSSSFTPTAAFMKAERSFLYDHEDRQWYLVGTVPKGNKNATDNLLQWMQDQSRSMQQYEPQVLDYLSQRNKRNGRILSEPVAFTPNRPKSTYNRNFDTCLEKIRTGDSYELCLTNQLESHVSTKASPFDLYRILRHRNPAPYSSFFDWNTNQRIENGSSFAICCTSPERFLSVKPCPNGSTMQVEAKPIKGTCARVLPQQGRSIRTVTEDREDRQRAEDLRSSVKNRAENLMIVDLLRNDLSRVCRTGSVHVTKLMDIESFATVHQMVSTIRGSLESPQQSAVSTLRACFPGGSMTGAPKLRTMEILNDLEEGHPRGPYAGCLGYMSANGAMDMNIVIRTAVLRPMSDDDGSWHVSVGAGGAITILSESDDEYDEMILKASAVMNAVGEWVQGEKDYDDVCLSWPKLQRVEQETMPVGTDNLVEKG
jgi:para-aminobenzoate synthetase